ncbi:MAG: FKBP-type peptidyl-prolyl cis-trans isomerase [Bacteroidales bacterium]
MRNIFRLLSLLMLAGLFALTACKKDDDNNKQAEIDEHIILDYLADHNLTAQRDPSGVYYIITEEGNGEHPTAQSTVSVYYKGYLTDGSVFDQTNVGTATFNLQGLIEGWKIAIPLLKEGGEGTFFIPSGLGYGSGARPGIPANSVLIFEIELVEVE